MSKTRDQSYVLVLAVPARNHRAHLSLFAPHSPFRARTVENKRQYSRHEKHRNKLTGD